MDTPTSNSPLTEVSEKSLDEIFSTDPLKLTEQDLVATVKYFREARETFLKEDAVKASAPKKGSTPAKAIASIGDLGL